MLGPGLEIAGGTKRLRTKRLGYEMSGSPIVYTHHRQLLLFPVRKLIPTEAGRLNRRMNCSKIK